MTTQVFNIGDEFKCGNFLVKITSITEKGLVYYSWEGVDGQPRHDARYTHSFAEGLAQYGH